jgi:PhoPQ-activated pathogenicity-related protein
MQLSLNNVRQIRAAYNRRLAKVAVQSSADTFVVNQSSVLRINICGENRHLRQAPNRWQKILQKILNKIKLLSNH